MIAGGTGKTTHRMECLGNEDVFMDTREAYQTLYLSSRAFPPVFLFMSAWWHWGFPVAWAQPWELATFWSFNLDLLRDLRGVTSSLWASVSMTKKILGECLEGKITVSKRECWRGKPRIQVLWFCFCSETICNNRIPQPLRLAWIRNSEVRSSVQTKLPLKTEGRQY